MFLNELTKGDLIIYEDENDKIEIEAFLYDETIWLPLNKIAELFEKNKMTISEHIKNIYNEGELDKNSTIRNFLTVQTEGNRSVKRNIDYYNLDLIIAVGYRTNSKKATKFRQWATEVLKSYIIKGYSINKEKLKNPNKYGKDYFDELLEIIKEIRTSERRFYQKVTDIFAECSIDYNKNSEIAKDFYATIQNKFHYAITNETAAEIIYHRADSQKEHMGLTFWKHSPEGRILKSDVSIAKNYLTSKELDFLQDIVNMYLDIAENRAKRQIPMKMQDWVEELNTMLKTNRYEVLESKGSISAEDAKEYAENEFEKFRIEQDKKYISDFDKIIDECKSKK
ncbi:MAG TPA: virulence RhuM family protein [Clostridiaceae bacterium]|nr:virulence RhuM family protein [Clostridiaceae bacterium]